MKIYYPAIFIPDRDGVTVEFPDLPGCVTQGDTLEEAFEMAEDAAAGWILSTIEDGENVPRPSPVGAVTTDEGFVNIVPLDIEEYAKQYSTKAIKKTLTIPEWLNTLAERAGVNFSGVLQTALKKQLGLTATLLEESLIFLHEQQNSLAATIPTLRDSFSQTKDMSQSASDEQSVMIMFPAKALDSTKAVKVN